jgi:hypothetical protein
MVHQKISFFLTKKRKLANRRTQDERIENKPGFGRILPDRIELGDYYDFMMLFDYQQDFDYVFHHDFDHYLHCDHDHHLEKEKYIDKNYF